MLPEPVLFSKLNAAGNDFICLDNTDRRFDELLAAPGLPRFIQAICRRGLAVGADGVIFACGLGTTGGVDVVVRFLEPDGSEAELCGNGTACFTSWIVDKGVVAGPDVLILTAAGTARGRLLDTAAHRVRVCIPDPADLRTDLALDLKGTPWTVDFLHNGVPHAVAFVEELDRLDIQHWGPAIRHHSAFQPRGVNANFVQVLDVGHIALRTYEFGVENETLACGTGAAAAAILACHKHAWPADYRRSEKAVRVDVRGNETVNVSFVMAADGAITDVCLDTRVRPIYDGTLTAEFLREHWPRPDECAVSGPVAAADSALPRTPDVDTKPPPA